MEISGYALQNHPAKGRLINFPQPRIYTYLSSQRRQKEKLQVFSWLVSVKTLILYLLISSSYVCALYYGTPCIFTQYPRSVKSKNLPQGQSGWLGFYW